jgi:hypothetical protein
MGEVIEIILDLSEITGEMKPLLGVNAGPSPIGDYHNPILTNQYQSIGVRSIRNHDIYRAHSMSGFYPDRTCNPETRTCYNFFTSDSSFSKIIEGGFEPYFRIGDGYDMVKPPSPQEYENWSDAAVKVISHYREGLWDGFISDMKYVEIWNEPDNIHFWPKPHTAEDFFHLYSITAKKIKMAFPDLKVGGPGFTQGAIKTENGRQFVRSFLAFVKKNNIPLDFISWHMYSNNPDDYEEAGLFFDSLLAEYELENVKTIVLSIILILSGEKMVRANMHSEQDRQEQLFLLLLGSHCRIAVLIRHLYTGGMIHPKMLLNFTAFFMQMAVRKNQPLHFPSGQQYQAIKREFPYIVQI